MSENEKEKEKEKDRPLILWLYASFLCGVFLMFAIGLHYGWVELKEDAKLTPDEIMYMCMLICGIISTTMMSRYLDMYDNIHPKVRMMVCIWEWVVCIACVIAIVDLLRKDDGIDWVRIGAAIGVLVAFAVGWTWFVTHKGKDEKSAEERLNEKNKAARIRWYDRHEIYESRSDMGLEIPGHTTIQWDGRRSYLHVRNHVTGFCFAMCLITALMIAGKHIDDVDFQSMIFLGCYIIGIVLLRGLIADRVDYAVLHTAIPYKEGVRYKLYLMGAYTLVGNVLSCIVFESAPGYEYWDVWGYVIWIVGYALLFFMTFLVMTIGNKNKGHDFAFFNIDGYEKKKRDPREEDGDENTHSTNHRWKK